MSTSGSDSYLGLLYPTEDYKVYGYLTSTHVKLILVTHNFNSKETSVRKVFESLHAAYIDAISNPFYTPGKVSRSVHITQNKYRERDRETERQRETERKVFS